MPRDEAVVEHGPRSFHLLGTVRGLRSEGLRVASAFDALRPAAVALGVGPEDLDGLSKFAEGASYEHEYSEADEVYAHYLGQFGEVELPPLDLVVAVRRARAAGLPMLPIDLPEAQYVDLFTRSVSGWTLLRYNRRVRQLARRPPRAGDALDFHLRWDAEVRRMAGFRQLEDAREAAMAASLQRGPLPEGCILVLVEAARLAGIETRLRASQPNTPEVRAAVRLPAQ
jgi:hypothetical protein